MIHDRLLLVETCKSRMVLNGEYVHVRSDQAAREEARCCLAGPICPGNAVTRPFEVSRSMRLEES